MPQMSLRSDTIRLAYERPALRAALLPIIAKEFPTPEALKDYLADHPNADPKNHTVAKPGGGKGEGEDEEPEKKEKPEKGDEGGGGVSAKLKSFLGKVKGVPKATAEAVSKAPKQVQKFVADPEARKSAVSTLGKAIQESPKKIVSKLHESAKKELKELKHATHAARKALRKPPEKWTKEDWKAVYAAGVYVAGAAVAAAGGGPLMAVAMVGKSFAMHVGIKAMHEVLDNGFLHFEAGETVLHALHFASEDEGGDEDEEALITSLVVAVARVLEEGISDEDMESILKGTEEPDFEDFGQPKASEDKEASLREATIRLAHARPDLRPHLLPLLRG